MEEERFTPIEEFCIVMLFRVLEREEVRVKAVEEFSRFISYMLLDELKEREIPSNKLEEVML